MIGLNSKNKNIKGGVSPQDESILNLIYITKKNFHYM